MKKLEIRQTLPIDLDSAWDFFSSPKNLETITPDDLSFDILSDVPDTMYEGLFILYRITPLAGIKMEWVTEIVKIKPKEYFIDEQRKGPYAIWHHEHHFKPVGNGVEMTDLLYYDVGKFVFGKVAEALFVDRKVKAIFDYRRKKLVEIFG